MAGEYINLEDIHLQVTCPGCGRCYGLSIKKPTMTHNCRCGNGYFTVHISGVKQKRANVNVDLSFTFETMTRRETVPVMPDEVTFD